MINVTEVKTCTVGSEAKFSLENLVGKCAFMLFCLRSSTSATSNAITNYVDIGDTCQGHGVPIYGKDIDS